MVVPRSERAVAEALRQSTSVLVVGAQSSLTGGATPRGETLLSTSAFTSFARLDRDHVRVGAGVTLAALDEQLAASSAFYPPAPTYLGATIGGAIATNAAGAATFKHGTTRAWIEGITVVLASGDVLDIQRGQTTANPDGYFELALRAGTTRVQVPSFRMPDTPKLSAGYFAAPAMDLIDLFIGAEGTLGVIVEATLRVAPVRPAFCVAFVTLRDRARALSLVSGLRNASTSRPSSTWMPEASPSSTRTACRRGSACGSIRGPRWGCSSRSTFQPEPRAKMCTRRWVEASTGRRSRRRWACSTACSTSTVRLPTASSRRPATGRRQDA
jgi:FAD/FMN-containing dehydrogenase